MCSHQNLKNYINKLNIEYYSENKITEFKSNYWQLFWHSHANVWCHLHWWSWMPQLLQINYATTESVSIHLLQYHICHLHQNNLQSINNNIYANQMQRSGFMYLEQSKYPSIFLKTFFHSWAWTRLCSCCCQHCCCSQCLCLQCCCCYCCCYLKIMLLVIN